MRSPEDIENALMRCKAKMVTALEADRMEESYAYADIINTLEWVLGKNDPDFSGLIEEPVVVLMGVN